MINDREHTEFELRRKDWVAWILRNGSKVNYAFHRVTIEGGEHIPKSGPGLLLPKHQFIRDVMVESVFVYALTKRYANYIMKATFPQCFRTILEMSGGIAIDRPKDIRMIKDKVQRKMYIQQVRTKAEYTARYISWLYRQGELVVSHPEGTRNQDGVGTLHTGIVEHATQTEQQHSMVIPIIPVGFEYKNHKHFRSHVIVRIGTPLYTHQHHDQKQLVAIIREHIAKLSGLHP